MILIWEFHVTGVYLHNSLPAEFGTIPIDQTKKTPKLCADQDAHFGDAFSTIFSHTHHCINNTSFFHNITLISIHCRCTVLLQNTSWCCTLEYHSYHKISDTISNHLWRLWFQVTCSAAIPSVCSGGSLTDSVYDFLSLQQEGRLAQNSALLCSWFTPQSSPWTVAETAPPST